MTCPCRQVVQSGAKNIEVAVMERGVPVQVRVSAAAVAGRVQRTLTRFPRKTTKHAFRASFPPRPFRALQMMDVASIEKIVAEIELEKEKEAEKKKPAGAAAGRAPAPAAAAANVAIVPEDV